MSKFDSLEAHVSLLRRVLSYKKIAETCTNNSIQNLYGKLLRYVTESVFSVLHRSSKRPFELAAIVNTEWLGATTIAVVKTRLPVRQLSSSGLVNYFLCREMEILKKKSLIAAQNFWSYPHSKISLISVDACMLMRLSQTLTQCFSKIQPHVDVSLLGKSACAITDLSKTTMAHM